MPTIFQHLTRDGRLLLATRFVRLFAYGGLSVVLVFYLVGVGLSEAQTGLLLTLTLIGDTVVSLFLTTRADRLGRRRMLIAGAVLMTIAGLVFAATRTFWILLLAATIGVISPSGQDVGPFLSIEQASLTQVIGNHVRTDVLAWYTLLGSIATAFGALAAGGITRVLQTASWSPLDGYRTVVIAYGAMGIALAALFSRLSRTIEATPQDLQNDRAGFSGVHKSRDVVMRLSALFALDAFGGGFIVQSFAAFWFYLRFGVNPAELGAIFFWANILAGGSALVAARLASRFGLIRTMVGTHLPSNVLLMLIPLMPSLQLAVLVLFARFAISQMDVPTRQSYVMAVVPPDERSAAAGITSVARTIGASISPVFVGLMFARPALINLPFFIAGSVKIVYDLLLYRAFVGAEPQESMANDPVAR